MKQRHRHAEVISITSTAEEEVKAIETLCNEYTKEDIFTMRATGLFWRQALSSDLTSESRPGSNKNKSRISMICCTNYTDSERLPLWLIGNEAAPLS